MIPATTNGVQCLPVENAGAHYVVAKEWLQSGLPFPKREALDELLARPHRKTTGKVRYGGSYRKATIYTPVDEDDFSYALLEAPLPEVDDASNQPGGPPEFAQYIRALEARCVFTESILPEQRSYLKSDYIQPWLRSLADNTISQGLSSNLGSGARFMIVGAAGAGKTTFLRNWILEETKRFVEQGSSKLPVYIALREWTPDRTIVLFVKQKIAALDGANVVMSFDRLAEKGALAVVFDGLDEIPFEWRDQAYSEIGAFLHRYSECKAIVSTRSGVATRHLYDFVRMEVQPFNDTQIHELLYHKLYDKNLWKGFLRRLKLEPVLRELIGNPLIITLLISRYLRNELKPSYVTEVLGSISIALLDEWDAIRGVTRSRNVALSSGRKLACLRTLAAHLGRKNQTFFGAGEVTEILDRSSPDFPSVQLLQMLSESTSIIRQRNDGNWEFRHRVFQEYFSALHWLDHLAVRVEEVAQGLTSRPANWLLQSLRFLIGLASDASEPIKRALEQAPPYRAETAIALSEAMTQRLTIDPSVLDGYAAYVKLVLESLIGDVTLEATSASEDVQPLKWGIRMFPTTSDDPSGWADSLSNLLQVLDRTREGSAGAALIAAISHSEKPNVRHLATFLQSDGICTVSISNENGPAVDVRVRGDLP